MNAFIKRIPNRSDSGAATGGDDQQSALADKIALRCSHEPDLREFGLGPPNVAFTRFVRYPTNSFDPPYIS
jgi:hypothetical protein